MSRSTAAERLRSLRRTRGWSQQRLADEAGLGVRTVRDLENGAVARPQMASLERIAGAFGLSAEDQIAFVNAWAHQSRTLSFTQQTRSTVDIEQMMQDKSWADRAVTALMIQLEMTVDAQGRQVRQVERRVDRVDDPSVHHRWTLYGNSPGTDIRKVRASSVGARLAQRLLFPADTPGDDLVAFRWEFADQTQGHRHHECTLDLSKAVGEKPEDSRWLIGTRKSPALLVMVLRFEGEPPSVVWQSVGADQESLARLNPVLPQAPGTYSLVLEDPGPGMHGFQW